jgi:hypothetical protein
MENPQESKQTKDSIRSHADFTFDIQNDTQKFDDMIDKIEKYSEQDNEIDISNYIDPKKLKKIQDDYLKELKENKAKSKVIQTQEINGKTIQKAETIGGSRTARKPEKVGIQKEIEKEAKEAGINQKELTEKLKNTIKQLEEEAARLEQSDEFKDFENQNKYTFTEEDIENSRRFLFNNTIEDIFKCSNGISTDKYISFVNDERYSTKTQPKEGSIDSTPKQLVYISKLSKQLGTQLLQESNLQLKFNNIDMTICNYFRNKKINDYKAVYILLREFFKKLIVASLSDVELAFRSQNNWISEEFKKLILKDVIMLQTLPPKLAKSWKIFVNELCKTNDASIYNDISKLDFILHIDCDFVVEETLAKSIKCMTPCFIYNYYLAAKSVYILCGLLDDWYDSVKNRYSKKDNETSISDNKNNENSKKESGLSKNELYIELINISKVCTYLYENSRFYENSTARSLPYSNEPISQELQVYYLNHTMMGPQYRLIKGLEKYIYGLI